MKWNDFYRVQSEYSELGKWQSLAAGLPGDVAGLVEVVQNVLIHQFWIVEEANYGVGAKALLDAGRDLHGEVNLLTAETILDRYFTLNDAPIYVKRSASQKVVGSCRDFTLLLVGFLRAKGVAVRSRSGVATYFEAGHYEDHFVVEYFNEVQGRWVLVDAQLDELMRTRLEIKFDVCDMPREVFLPAGVAMTKAMKEGNFGDYGIREFEGMTYLRYKLFSEVCHLMKIEILPWEAWGIGEVVMDGEISEADERFLDEIRKALMEEDLAQVRGFLHDERFERPDGYVPYEMRFPFFEQEG
jgi:hypothetical protein